MKNEKKVNKKKSYADRPYLIFLAMLVETKNFFSRLSVIKCADDP